MDRDPAKVRAWEQRSRQAAIDRAKAKQRAPIPRTGNLRARSPRKAGRYAAIAAACAAAIARDGHRCQARLLIPEVACGGPLDPQHVIPQGASTAQASNVDNIITVCRSMHEWLHAHPLLAQSMGLSVPRHALDLLGADAVLAVATELRYRLCCGDPAFAPWLTDPECSATALQDQRWVHAAPLERSGSVSTSRCWRTGSSTAT